MKKIKKLLGNYQLRFEQEYGSTVRLTVKMTADLKALLNKVVVRGGNQTTTIGQRDIQRYKIKSWLATAFRHRYKYMLFVKELIDSGETTFELPSASTADEVMGAMHDVSRHVVYYIVKYNKDWINYETEETEDAN
jgi:hypothetical protein